MAWKPYVYQYGVMLVLFGLGLLLVWRQGDIGFNSGRKRRNLLLLVGGMAFFMLLQGFLQFRSPPVPARVHGEPSDRFFARYFVPQGPAQEVDGVWKMPMRVEGTWFYCPSGNRQVVFRIEQQIDAGPPGEQFKKVCPVFNAPLTDWHDEVLDHFREHGFHFSDVSRRDCLPACRKWEPEHVDACQESCVAQCRAQRIRLLRGMVR